MKFSILIILRYSYKNLEIYYNLWQKEKEKNQQIVQKY